MYQRNRYDLVVTTKEDEKDKILNPTESCQLVSGKTYTYVNNIVLNFTLEDKKVHILLTVELLAILDHHLEQPKS